MQKAAVLQAQRDKYAQNTARKGHSLNVKELNMMSSDINGKPVRVRQVNPQSLPKIGGTFTPRYRGAFKGIPVSKALTNIYSGRALNLLSPE